MTEHEAFTKIRDILLPLLEEQGFEKGDISMKTSIVGDLAFESIRFVELALGLEKSFGIGEFPMRDWADEQLELGDDGFRVASLVERCIVLAKL